MSNNHRFAFDSSSITSHFNIAHTTKAVKNEDIPYTSASTAENQADSEKVNDNAPTIPAPISTHIFSSVSSASFVTFMIFLPNKTIDQKRNRTAKELANTLLKFIQ